MAFPCSDGLGGLQKTARPFGELFQVHVVSPLKSALLEHPL